MTASERRLKVVRIVARLNVGGPARHVAILAQGLVSSGFDTVVVHGSLSPGEASLECREGDHVRVTRVPELGRDLHAIKDVAALLRVAALLFAERPDVVHTHTSKAGALGRLAAFLYNLTQPRSRRCVVVHTFHGHVFEGYFGRTGNALAMMAERILSRLTDTVVTISPIQRDAIVRQFRVAPERKVAVVPLGLDLAPFWRLEPRSSRLRSELGFGDSVVFGFVGRLVPIKDPATLVAAFANVRARVPGVRLMMVGDGALRTGMERLVAQLGLTDSVAFLGWRADLPEVYGAMDVLTLSSRNEGTPVAAIEAMASGKAVIATAAGGTPDVVADGGTGLLVPPGDVEALASAMIRLAEAPDLARQLGAAGRICSQRYRAARLITETADIYRADLKRTRPHFGAGADR
jgi:glycosyltransferase involved in cell wall biosynthesis